MKCNSQRRRRWQTRYQDWYGNIVKIDCIAWVVEVCDSAFRALKCFRQRALKCVFRVLRPPDETPLANGHFDARRYSFHNCDYYLLRLTWCGGAMSQSRSPKQLVH